MKKRIVKSAFNSTNSSPDQSKKKPKSGRKRLVKYEALPDYLQDNEYIRNHYRCEWPLKDVILSIFSLHNETLNIWTHLLGFGIFAALMILSLTDRISPEKAMATLFRDGSDGWFTFKDMNRSKESNSFFTDSYAIPAARYLILGPNANNNNNNSSLNSTIPLWPWFVFLFGAMTCLIFSSISHLFACHSRKFYYFFWRLDYAGISLMIVCSFFPPVYYTFADHKHWLILYLSSITIFGVLVVLTLLTPALSSGCFRSFRATLFLCMGFSGVIPAIHALILHSDHHDQIWASLGYEIAMGLLYAIGAVFYVTRIPERWKPGAFDIIGHSHQIFHVFVVAAALAHGASSLILMEWRRSLSV